MRVPVLTILPAQEPLRESATARAAGRAPDISLRRAAIPPGLELDASFGAVPVAVDGQAGATVEDIAPDRSQSFVVRGFIEAESIEQIPTESGGQPVFADPVIAPFITCGGTPPVGSAADVQNNLNVAALAARGLDGNEVAIAIMDTGINLAHLTSRLGFVPKLDAANSWRPPGSTIPPGASPVDHGTMCAYDALLAAPKATLLDFPILAARAPGGTLSSRTLSVAIQAYAQVIISWSVAFGPGGLQQYKGLVINNSWGVFHPSWDFPPGHPGRYIDNPNHPFNSIIGTLTRSGVDILFAAGNCGAPCADGRCQGRTTETIMGANSYQEVLTVAGCDTTDARVGYSSQGPSIANMFQDKPDLTCYTHFSGSEAFGPGSPDSGTSAACPVAAGCVAAIRTKLSPAATPPANLIAQLTATARQVAPAPGWNADYGFGILDPDQAAASLGV
jgi:hypothetical protein